MIWQWGTSQRYWSNRSEILVKTHPISKYSDGRTVDALLLDYKDWSNQSAILLENLPSIFRRETQKVHYCWTMKNIVYDRYQRATCRESSNQKDILEENHLSEPWVSVQTGLEDSVDAHYHWVVELGDLSRQSDVLLENHQSAFRQDWKPDSVDAHYHWVVA